MYQTDWQTVLSTAHEDVTQQARAACFVHKGGGNEALLSRCSVSVLLSPCSLSSLILVFPCSLLYRLSPPLTGGPAETALSSYHRWT